MRACTTGRLEATDAGSVTGYGSAMRGAVAGARQAIIHGRVKQGAGEMASTIRDLMVLRCRVGDSPIANTKKTVMGLPVTVEAPKGTTRKLHNADGKVVYKVHMYHDYGFIDKTKGRDGDEVDCFTGPVPDAKEVYIVHMKDMGPDVNQREDEDKVMLGFPSADAAKTAFLLHYPPAFYDGMTSLPLAKFNARLAQTQKKHVSKKLNAAKMLKCPKCGSGRISLMPTDFETAKCRGCGKLFPFDGIKAGGPGSGRRAGAYGPAQAHPLHDTLVQNGFKHVSSDEKGSSHRYVNETPPPRGYTIGHGVNLRSYKGKDSWNDSGDFARGGADKASLEEHLARVKAFKPVSAGRK